MGKVQNQQESMGLAIVPDKELESKSKTERNNLLRSVTLKDQISFFWRTIFQ